MNKISKFLLFSKIISVMILFFEIFCKKSLGFLISLLTTIHIWTNWVGSNFSELLMFLCILFPVKFVFPERIATAIYLVLPLIVHTPNVYMVYFFFFESGRVYFEIHLETLYHLPVMFEFMGTVTFLVFGIMWIPSKSGMVPLLAVLALMNS